MSNQASYYYKVRWSYADGGCSGWLNARYDCIEDADLRGDEWVIMTSLQSEEPAKTAKSLSYSIHGFKNV